MKKTMLCCVSLFSILRNLPELFVVKVFYILFIAALCFVFLTCSIPSDLSVCRVSYDGNGWSGGTVPVDPVEYTSSQIVLILDDLGHLECPGYSFGGWNTSSDGTGTFYQPGDTLETTSVDVTLYAVWLPASLMISEVGDPLEFEGRFVELYNSTSTAINLKQYMLREYLNGGMTSSNATTLPDINLASESTYVIANNSNFSDVYSNPDYQVPDEFSFSISGNGNDVYELFDGVKTVDLYGIKGEEGLDPLTFPDWEYTDRVVQRNLSVILGTDQFDISEWTKGDNDSNFPASPGSRFSN